MVKLSVSPLHEFAGRGCVPTCGATSLSGRFALELFKVYLSLSAGKSPLASCIHFFLQGSCEEKEDQR
jgi:hypothetical protein